MMNTVLLNNRYQILHTLGRGGFGETFLASDVHMPSGRKCVIKQLKPAIQDPQAQQEALKRFQQEAAILEKLGEDHSQIPRLYAYFCERGSFYLVQEWIEGVTLRQKIEQQGTLKEAEVRDVLVNLLQVLDYVHSRRIVHRDVKPENIILRHADGKPVLIDFGAVRDAIATVVNPNGSTAFSVAIGTPGYMPSEQAAGRPVYSSDLYSLGLTAIYLLTGKSPNQLETDPRTAEILWRDPAPNRHSHLAAVIDRAIRFHPRDRFPTAREMLTALQPSSVIGTVATLAVAPGFSRHNSPQFAPETTVVVTNRAQTKPKSWFSWLLLLLLLGGIGAGTGIGLGLWNERQQDRQTASSPEPADKEAQTFPPAEFPGSVAKSTPETPEQEPASPPPEEPEASTEPSPDSPQEAAAVPAQAPPETAASSPTAPPADSSPSPESQPTPPETQGSSPNVPIFSPGASESQVSAALGEPNSKSAGYWPNTSAWLYQNYVPNEVDLGYLFDVNTNKLRQTEVSFSQSVSLATMQNALNSLLGGSATPEIQEGLAQIYQRQNDLRSFSIGNLKGMINRNDKDRIYLAIWEADLH